jgi:hypothetical protein
MGKPQVSYKKRMPRKIGCCAMKSEGNPDIAIFPKHVTADIVSGPTQ